MWYENKEFKYFPILFRVFIFYCAHGIKRYKGGTLGGNKLFNLIRKYYLAHPYKGSNFVTIPANNRSFYAVLDLLDFEIFQHSVSGFSRDRAEKTLLSKMLPKKCTFIDVGANCGLFTLNAANIGGVNSVVYAFEPQPRLVEALNMSKTVNGFKQISIFNIALGNKVGNVTFFIPKLSSGSGSLLKSHANKKNCSNVITVEMSTLDKSLQSQELHKIDLLKIDVEGYELNVIQGARKILTSYHPFIWLEMNPGTQELAGVDQESIYQILEEFGYDSFYSVTDIVKGVKREVRRVTELTDILAVPKGKHEKIDNIIIEFECQK